MSATLRSPGKRDFTQGVGFSEVPDGGSVSGTVGEAWDPIDGHGAQLKC